MVITSILPNYIVLLIIERIVQLAQKQSVMGQIWSLLVIGYTPWYIEIKYLAPILALYPKVTQDYRQRKRKGRRERDEGNSLWLCVSEHQD